jgi:two-component system phosphate regulon sensor histidine kinase PhoR
MRFRRHMWWASIFVLTPVGALLVVGILVLVFQRAAVDITFGVLILIFCVTLLVGAIVLVVSLKRATDLSQLQLDFLSKVSHEFRTPLTSIRLFTQTLMEPRPLTDEQREPCLTMLDHETERLSTMIGRLLDFGRMEAGKMVYHRQPESVDDVVEAALRAFEAIRLREHVQLATSVAPDLPPILADRAMLSQALLNLLQNAAKYGGEGCEIDLVCRAENGHVALAVADKGPGIPRRERRRIFERFYRIDDRLNRKQEGSGLGLAIVRHVVQAHGGRVTVRNRPEGGAEFSILLPVYVEREKRKDPRAKTQDQPPQRNDERRLTTIARHS